MSNEVCIERVATWKKLEASRKRAACSAKF